MNFKPYFFSFLVTLACGKEQEFIHSRLPNAIAVVGRSFQYFLSPQVDLPNTFKVSERGKSSLPKWLSFDLTKSQFYGVAQWRDKGEVEIEVKSLKEDKKAVFTIYVQDLHTVLNNQSSFSNETKVADFTEPNCVDGLPVAVATVLFDLNIDTLSGADRQNLMRRLSDFVNVNIKNLHMTVGRGHNTAFGFKDVTMVTAGPGNVADSKQPGIAVSWQIGCGLDVSGIEVASLLKSSSERGVFKQMLDAPVTGWHIATGHPKSHRQRVRRQINNLRPTPIVTQMPGSVIHRQIISYATQTYTMAPPTLIPGSITVTVPAPVIPTVTVNQAPIAMKSLGPMTVYLGKELRFTIPEDIIYDQEDGSVRNLRLQMKTGSGLDLSPASWILFDSAKQEIYGFPSSADVIGSHRFLLIATDSGGKSLTFPFTLEVSSARPVTFSHKVTIVLNYTKSFMDHVVVRLNLMTKIARYYGFPLDQLRVSSYKYYHGALFFTFQVDSSKVNADCDNQEFRALRDGIGNNMRLNPNLIKALLPEFQIMYGYFEGMGRCKDPSVPNTPPQVKRPIGQPVVVVWGQALHYSVPFDTFYDEHDHYTPNLMLQLRTENNQALPSTSWIQFDAARQVIYGITNDLKMVGQHSYRIVAVDSGGLEAFTSLNITVLSDRANYSHQFGIVLSHLSYTDLAGNAKIRVSLIESIAHYYGLALNRVRIAKYVHGPSVHFRFDSIPHEDCDNPELVRLIDGFWIRQKNEVNRTFVTHLKRDNFTVGTVHFNGLDSCTEVTPGIDSPPSGRRRLRLEVYLGQALNFKIPYKTFYDEQDFYTPNLNLFIRTLENREIPRWLVVDARQHILALPLNRSCVPSNEFYLVAEDSKKQEGQVDLRVKVLEDGNQYNHEFTIRLKNFVFKDNVAIKLKVLEKIAAYYGLSYKNVRVPIQGPKDAFTFRFDTVPYRDCNHRNLTKLVRGFWSGNKLNPKFLEALKPDFEIISGYYKLLEPCAPVNTPPVVVNPVATLALMQGQRGKFQIPVNTFYDKEDGYTTNLTLKASFDSNDLPSWIFFNSTKQDMISLPIDDSTVGTHKLLLTAEDSGGFAATDVVELKVTKDTTKFKNEFRFVVEDATEPVDKVQTKILMMYKVAAYFGVSLEEVHLSGFGSEYPPTLTFHLRTLGALKCDDSSLSKVIDSFMENGKLNQNFVDAMEPEFTVSTGAHKGLGLCTPPPSAPNTPPPSAPNTPPEIYNHIDRLDVFQGQGLRFHVPYDSFFDKEDGYTPNLSLQMRTIEGHELPNTSWILFNSSSQEIFGLPADVNKIGLHEILLIASDKEGGRAYDAFEVRVLEEDAPFNHKFNIILDYGNATFLRNVGVRVSLLDAIANYFGVNFTSVRVVSYAPGVLFSFYFDFVPYDECSHSFLMKLLDGFWLNGGLNPAFSSALLPGFRVISGSYERLGPCQSVIGPEVGAKVGDRPGGIWWTYAIIPAIVVAIVLLILGCCLLVMMGCCRRTKMSGADQMTYIYKKKPVVLKEEYEIKEMLLKQPLVLPNEKPPVPPVYSRSPVLGGDKTPLLNAESKSVPYQAPVFMSSRQMGGGGGGGGGSGNAGFVANGGGPAAGAGAAGGGAAVLGGGSGAMGGGLGAAAGGGGGGGGGGAAAGAGFSAGGGGGMGSGMSAGSGGAASSGAASAAAIGNGASQGGGGGGAGGGGGGAGGGGYSVSYSMSTGGRGFKQSSFSYSYSSSSGGVSSSGRKMAYSGYRLPPAYVPP